MKNWGTTHGTHHILRVHIGAAVRVYFSIPYLQPAGPTLDPKPQTLYNITLGFRVRYIIPINPIYVYISPVASGFGTGSYRVTFKVRSMGP